MKKLLAILATLGFIGIAHAEVTLTHVHGLAYSADGKRMMIPSHHGLAVYENGKWSKAPGPQHEWNPAGEATLRRKAARVGTSQSGLLHALLQFVTRAGTRSTLVDLGAVPLLDRDLVIRVRATPKAEGMPLTETAAIAAGTDASGLIWRRGPTTGMKYVLTADRRISRTDRIRVEVPVAEGVSATAAALLDRAGSPLDVAVTANSRADDGVQWATAEVALAPLAPGEYVLRLTLDGPGESREMFTAIRVTP